MLKKPLLLFCLILFFLLSSAKEALSASARNIPPLPCDFYGTEEVAGALKKDSVITAKDPQGKLIGQYVLRDNGRYGFLTCKADDPDTPEDEGAVNGDLISFYIDDKQQQKQAIWKSGQTIQVDLGLAFEGGAFNLHLVAMPGYTNYAANPNFSAVAVADMILDFLEPANADTQSDLMAVADLDADGITTGLELAKLLNQKAPGEYDFGSLANLQQLSERGYIDKFDATNQNDCIRQICHWLSYKVPNVEQGKEYVPVAICTSSNPAINADSDYQHWMSLVGVKTNQDPFPNLPHDSRYAELFTVPQTLELYGLFLNDPAQSGLGFHNYMAADVWAQRYFRPIAADLEDGGKYVAVMEPPEPQARPVEIISAQKNDQLQVKLVTPQKEVSIFIPGLTNPQTQEYLLTLLKRLRDSSDFATLIEDIYFGQTLENTQVNRCFKIDGKVNNDYTIIPFDKIVDGKLATTLAALVNNETAQLQMASAEPNSTHIFMPMSLANAYKTLRKQIGWGQEFPINFWLSHSAGSALFPGWDIVTLKPKSDETTVVLNSVIYSVTVKNEISIIQPSPQIKSLRSVRIGTSGRSTKFIFFEVTHPEEYSVAIEQENNCRKTYLWNHENLWLAVLIGKEDANCIIKAKGRNTSGNIRQGGVTYLYIRK